jgi:hypothetical protein
MLSPSSGSKNSQARNQRESGSKQSQEPEQASSVYYLLHPGFLLSLFFDPEDGGDMFL